MAEITFRISDKALKILGIGLGALCLVWVAGWVWSSGFFHAKYRLRVYVPEVARMTAGAHVRLDAIDVGDVETISLATSPSSPERRVELILRIEKRYQDKIRTDSTAAFVTEGLLGNRYVSISEGFSGSPIPAGGEITAVQMRELTLKDFTDALAKWVDCFAQKEPATKDKIRSH